MIFLLSPTPFTRRAGVLLFLLFCTAPLLGGGKKPAGSPPQEIPVQEAPHFSQAADEEKLKDLPPAEDDRPVYVAEVPNINDFTLFANGGGWDGNWYVGYNTCWVSKLPPIPEGTYARAFIGAKLGRMKTEPIPGRPSWEKRPIKGEVDIAVSQEPIWPQSRRFLLTETKYIPLEGDKESAIEGVGESRWFWIEVPLRFVSSAKDNYLALFSPSKKLKDSEHSPVLAAANGNKKQNTWLTSTAKGEPPFNRAEALKTSVTYFEPAVAIKLVPPNDRSVGVQVHDLTPDGFLETEQKKFMVSASVSGDQIQSCWIDYSTDTKKWTPAVPAQVTPPFLFTLKKNQFFRGEDVYLRVVARDLWENQGMSPVFAVVKPGVRPKPETGEETIPASGDLP